MILFLLILFFVFFLNCDMALSEENFSKIYDPFEVTIKQGKIKRDFVLMNSGYDVNCWYYAGLDPKLDILEEEQMPNLALIQYQRPKEGRIDKLEEGAVFTCVFDIDEDEDVVNQLKKLLPKDIDKNKLRLKPLPLDRLELKLMGSDKKDNVNIVSLDNQGLGALHNSKIRFTTILTAKNATLYETLLNSKTGIDYNLVYNYSLLSDKLKQKIKVKLKKNKIFLEETLNDESNIDLRYLKSLEKCPKFIREIIKEASNRKESVKQETSDGVGDDIDLKNLGHKKKNVSSGKTDYGVEEFSKFISLFYRSKQEKYLAAAGFISLIDYPDSVKKKIIVQDISYDNLKYAYLMMPTIGDKSMLNIKEIAMKVSLNYKKTTYETRVLKWTEKKDWRTEDNRPAIIERFSLDKIADEKGASQIDNAEFRIESIFEFYNDTKLITELKMPVINGSSPVTTPFSFADTISFDFTNIFWEYTKEDKNRLEQIEINIKDKNRYIKRIVKPEKIKGTKALELPEILSVITSLKSFEKDNLKINVYFKKANGKRIPWQYNDTKLSNYFESPYFMFNDEDWRNE